MVNQGQAMGTPAMTLRRCPVCERRVGAQDEICWMCGSDLSLPSEPSPLAGPVALPGEAAPAAAPAPAPPSPRPLRPRLNLKKIELTRPHLPDLSGLSLPRLALVLLGLLTLGLLARTAFPRSVTASPTPTAALAVIATTPIATPTTTRTPTQTPAPTATPSLTPTPTHTATQTPLPTRVYVIRPNDTLLAIASQYNVTVEAILEANPGLNATRLQPNQEIIIPWPTPTASPTSAGTMETGGPSTAAASTVQLATFTYTVQPGDTLLDIALKYGVPVETIRQLNQLRGDLLQAGQTLILPLPTPTPTLTPTPGPSPTPTPRPPYEAPVLLSPVNETVFDADDPIVLQWTSVGILGEGEWYQVTVVNTSAPGSAPYRVTTKTTSLRLPPDLRPSNAAPQTFQWNVVVVRQAGTYSDGSPRYVLLSPTPPSRTFVWQGHAPTPTSTP